MIEMGDQDEFRGVKAHYSDDRSTVYHGDCIEVMRSLPDNSVDAVVTDPPYGLEFMGKDWDAPWKRSGDVEWVEEGTDASHPFRDGSARIRFGAGGEASYGFQLWVTDFATEALRVLKPGGHLLAFGGTRTWHRLAVGIEDAGFEIRDSIAWLYGSGFPKSLDVSKAIDKRAGVEREVVGKTNRATGPSQAGKNGIGTFKESNWQDSNLLTAPATPEANQWAGFGTALKPAHEPIVVARKPLGEKTVAANVLKHGTGALNIDGSRIGMTDADLTQSANNWKPKGYESKENIYDIGVEVISTVQNTAGRWPANVILDESQAAELDRQSGVSSSTSSSGHKRSGNVVGDERSAKAAGIYGDDAWIVGSLHNDSGGASRFFYVAKANKSERPRDGDTAHPTVKPLALMRYLVRLVTPPDGIVLEPFAGSGTTVEAALLEGFSVIGIEMTEEYLPLIMQRIERYGEGMF